MGSQVMSDPAATGGPDPLLDVSSLFVSYGQIPALKGVSLAVQRGQVVAIMGANGAGKSTLLNAIAGFVPYTGQVKFSGESVDTLPSEERVGRGIVSVPEGRHLFPFLPVEENLKLGSWQRPLRKAAGRRLREVYDLMPFLSGRRNQLAGSLSGGEQQLVAIGRALMARPRLLLLDEPSLGLSPVWVESVYKVIRGIAHEGGPAIVVVEPNVVRALEESSEAYVLANGLCTEHGESKDLQGRDSIRRAYMGM